MRELRPAARLYLLLLGVGALGSLALGLWIADPLGGQRLALACALSGLILLTYLFPLHFAYKTKLALDTSVIFAVALLFQPGVAVLIVGCGTALAHAVRREPWVQGLFNSSQAMLQ